jgi:hypothetical protein
MTVDKGEFQISVELCGEDLVKFYQSEVAIPITLRLTRETIRDVIFKEDFSIADSYIFETDGRITSTSKWQFTFLGKKIF